MKKYLSYFMGFFPVMFALGYCLAAGPMDSDSRKDSHHGQTGLNYALSGEIENGIRVIEVKASRYKFDPDPIAVNLGEKVRLRITSTDVAHGLAIPEFKINVSVAAGKTETVEFVVDKKGSFLAYCSVYCGPGHSSMQANFIVQ